MCVHAKVLPESDHDDDAIYRQLTGASIACNRSKRKRWFDWPAANGKIEMEQPQETFWARRASAKVIDKFMRTADD